MKYTKGTQTLLGQITVVDKYPNGKPYKVVMGKDYVWFTESEIDKIVVKPKRNIDRLSELVEEGKLGDAVKLLYRDMYRYSPWKNLLWLLDPYKEPSKYPKLTPEELKAVKWLVEGGFTRIYRCMGGWATVASEKCCVATQELPSVGFLNSSSWITKTQIDLKELLKAQEEV